jgi:mannose-1-phosphate guanylyltransferase
VPIPVTAHHFRLSSGGAEPLWPLARRSAQAFHAAARREHCSAKRSHAHWRFSAGDIVTITNRDYYFHTKDVYAVLLPQPRSTAFLLERFGNNTAAAVALAAFHTQKHHGSDAVMLARRSSDAIRLFGCGDVCGRCGACRFTGHVRHPSDASERLRLYRMRRALAQQTAGDTPVLRAAVRPATAQAHEYLAAGNYVWNSGIFCFPHRRFSTPSQFTHQRVDAIRRCGRRSPQKARPRCRRSTRRCSPPCISLDYAVMEKAAVSGNVAIICGSFDWSDVGSWRRCPN